MGMSSRRDNEVGVNICYLYTACVVAASGCHEFSVGFTNSAVVSPFRLVRTMSLG